MSMAIIEAEKCLKTGDVPVGAIIVDESGNIIAKAHNTKEKDAVTIKHAEINAIVKANKKIKNWHLDNCTMYVTLEPCMMCTGAIIDSRLKKLVYGCSSLKYGFINTKYKISSNNQGKRITIVNNVCSKECKKIIQNFFKTKRS